MRFLAVCKLNIYSQLYTDQKCFRKYLHNNTEMIQFALWLSVLSISLRKLLLTRKYKTSSAIKIGLLDEIENIDVTITSTRVTITLRREESRFLSVLRPCRAKPDFSHYDHTSYMLKYFTFG